MKSGRRKPIAPILELTPLVDVVFLLLTFYMLTSTFVSEKGLPLELPESGASAAMPEKIISVSIVDDSQVQLGEKVIAIGDLAEALRSELSEEAVVYLRADKSGSVQTFVRVLEAVKKTGVETISIATESSIEERGNHAASP